MLFPHAKENIKPEFNIVYHFENEVTNRLIYLFIAEIKDDAILCTPRFKEQQVMEFQADRRKYGQRLFQQLLRR